MRLRTHRDGNARRSMRRERTRTKPRLEMLEDRCLLSVLETINVPADGSAVVSSTVLQSGVHYTLMASGYLVIAPSVYCDAEYAFGPGIYPSTLDRDINPAIDPIGVDFGIGVNDAVNSAAKFPKWGPYNDSHAYTYDFVGLGAPISLNFHDALYTDNSGFMTVQIIADQPDLSATSLTWNTAQDGVDFSYSVSGTDLSPTQSTKASLYWASGPNFTDVIGSSVYDVTIAGADGTVGVHGPYYVPNAVLTANSPTHSPPFGAKYLLLAVNDNNAVTESDGPFDSDPNNVKSIPILPDLAATSLTWDSGLGGADFSYSISGSDLPQPTTAALYWAPDPTFNASADALITGSIITTQTAVGTYGPFDLITAVLGTPRIGDKYLLLVVNPDHTVTEADAANDTNNVLPLRLPPAVVNVVTHGFNPGVDWNSFKAQFDALGNTLNSLPVSGSALAGKVTTYVPTWDSTSGWDEAMVSVAASLILPPPADALARRIASLFMSGAARNAEQAAQAIDDVITNPQNGYLVTPAFGQVIDLIGHSRGAAVNARLSQLLTNQGYTVDQYTSLDGYSTDWQYPSSILGDISITGAATAALRYNAEVEQGLASVFLQWLESRFSTPLAPGDIRKINAAALNWRAPDRPGFVNFTVTGTRTGDTWFSNHLDIVKLFSNNIDYLTHYTYVGRHRSDGLSSAHAIIGSAVMTNSLPVTSQDAIAVTTDVPATTSPDYSNFTDGSLESVGSIWSQVKAANIHTADSVVLSNWVNMVDDPARMLASEWIVTGDAKLVRDGDNTAIELTLSPGVSSIGQYLEFDSKASSIGFGVSVPSGGEGDRLQVLFGDTVLGTYNLSNSVSNGHYVVPLSGLASKQGVVTFRLTGPNGSNARILLDNLAVNESGTALTISPIPSQTGLPGQVFTAHVSATDTERSPELTFSLDPGSPSGATINPQTGVFSWTASASVAPGTYLVTVRATDFGTPILSTTKSFTITVQDVTPVVTLGSSITITQGATFSHAGSFSSLAAGSFTATVDYGDGTGLKPLALNSAGTFALSHAYARPGTFTVTVAVTASTGQVGTQTEKVTVAYVGSGFGKGPDDFVTTLYKEVLGRAPESAGLFFWSKQLASKVPPKTVATSFWVSRERSILLSQHKAPPISFGRAFSDAMNAWNQATKIGVAHPTGKASAKLSAARLLPASHR